MCVYVRRLQTSRLRTNERVGKQLTFERNILSGLFAGKKIMYIFSASEYLLETRFICVSLPMTSISTISTNTYGIRILNTYNRKRTPNTNAPVDAHTYGTIGAETELNRTGWRVNFADSWPTDLYRGTRELSARTSVRINSSDFPRFSRVSQNRETNSTEIHSSSRVYRRSLLLTVPVAYIRTGRRHKRTQVV